VLGFFVALAPVLGRAQQPTQQPAPAAFASLSGVVDDSIRGGPLAGALVTVVGTTRHATTGLHGEFVIDSIAPGSHSVIVTHPLLDTLGLKVHSASFTLAGGQGLRFGLSTPSLADIRDQSCPTGGAVYGPGILLGRVNKADSDDPASGATVSLVFKNLSAGASPERVRAGHADATGLFAICGLPSMMSGNVQASFGGTTTPDLPVKLSGEVVATAILSVGVAGGGSAVLRGTVTTKTGAPVAGAQVSMVGTSTVASTADDGSFTLSGLPSGTREAVARKIGFAQTSKVVALSSRQAASVIIVLDEAQVLRTVKVVGKLDGGLTKIGFTGRQQVGMGWFLTPDEIEKRQPIVTTDVLRLTAGMRVVNATNGTLLQATRGPSSTSDGCINIFIDHTRFQQSSPGDIDSAMPVDDLGAVEFYANPTTVPPDFMVAGKTCATVVLWSKTTLLNQKP
jgi:hypothetical protein